MTDQPDPLTESMTAAMHGSVQKARAMHRALGLPVAVWRDGRVQLLDPTTLETPPWPSSVRDGDQPPRPPQR